MLPRTLLLWMTCCVALFWSSAAFTQPYPSRPVTLVVPYAAGSGVDILARILTAKLGQRLGQPIIVEAKPGAGSAIGTDFVAKSVPNGYTLMLTTNVLPVLPALYRSVPFNPVSDFTHISKVATGSMALVVNPTVLPIKSLDELVARARASLGSLTTAPPATGHRIISAWNCSNSNSDWTSYIFPIKAPRALSTTCSAGKSHWRCSPRMSCCRTSRTASWL